MDLIVEIAPTEVEGIVKQYDFLSNEIKTIKNLLLGINARGFEVGTSNVEKIIKLNIQHLTGAIKVMKEEINTKLNKIRKAVYKQIPIEKPSINDIRATLQKSIPELKQRGKTAEILAILASNPNKEFTSRELADIVYGKDHKYGRGHVSRYLKQFSKFVKKKKIKRIMYYKWKDTKLIKQ